LGAGAIIVAGAANEIEKLAELVAGAKRLVAFTGAGISTECGIPDFRSPGGLWTRYKPIEYAEFLASPDTRLEAWRRYFRLYEEVRGAKPGRGHQAIAHWVKTGKAGHVITQNIDNLHQDSGVPKEQIIELHGNGTFACCLACGTRHELDWVLEEIERHARAPDCRRCSGIVKTATISFGQPMPEAVMAEAHGATEACDLFLAIGSSLRVYPAATLPLLARRWGAKLVIINNEPTDFDEMADLVINRDIGETLSAAAGRVANHSPSKSAPTA
jgi:NAD-dependent deacetylase